MLVYSTNLTVGGIYVHYSGIKRGDITPLLVRENIENGK